MTGIKPVAHGWRRVRTALAALGVGALLAAAPVGSASAAATTVIQPVPTSAVGSAAAHMVTPQLPPIFCTHTLTAPAWVTGSPQRANVRTVVEVNCTSTVPIIEDTLTIALNGVVIAVSTPAKYGATTFWNPVIVPCRPGTYTATSVAHVVFPPGYGPPDGTDTESRSTTIPVQPSCF